MVKRGSLEEEERCRRRLGFWTTKKNKRTCLAADFCCSRGSLPACRATAASSTRPMLRRRVGKRCGSSSRCGSGRKRATFPAGSARCSRRRRRACSKNGSRWTCQSGTSCCSASSWRCRTPRAPGWLQFNIRDVTCFFWETIVRMKGNMEEPSFFFPLERIPFLFCRQLLMPNWNASTLGNHKMEEFHRTWWYMLVPSASNHWTAPTLVPFM